MRRQSEFILYAHPDILFFLLLDCTVNESITPPSLYKCLRNVITVHIYTHSCPTRCNNIITLFMRVDNGTNLKLFQFF